MNCFVLVTTLLSFFQLSAAGDEFMFSLTHDYTYSNNVFSQPLLVNQAFGNSWNTPSNVKFTPPAQKFTRVVLELNVNSTGSNYDRLGQLFLDDIEIWRTSTAEPDNSGASWSVSKDVSHYASLFKSERTINFLIQNRVTDEYTGIFYVNLIAHFYDDESSPSVTDDSWAVDLNNPPSSIQALVGSGNVPGHSWSAPGDPISVNVGPLDRSTNRALVHVFASGSGDDEFWWDSDHTSSSGPSRFVDVYVGGQLAGFAAPFPVIYTGGVNPLLWRPLVDVRTYDIPAYFIDITPFLPTLWDSSTPIEIKISNGINGDDVPSNWVVNYNLFLWQTGGQSNSGTLHTPEIHNSNSGTSGELITVSRNVTTSATLNIGGQIHEVQWQQDVSFSNTLQTQSSSNSHVWQDTVGTSSISGLYDFEISYDYPFQCEMDVDSYYRVQQALKSEANNGNYYTWIDTSVNLLNGDYQNGKSSQWLSFPGGTHFASTQNLNLVERW